MWWEDRDGAWRSEVVRFTGEHADSYEDRHGTQFDLYEYPGGYRAFVYGEGGAHLHPFEVDRNDGSFEYGLYGAEEVARNTRCSATLWVARGSGTYAELEK